MGRPTSRRDRDDRRSPSYGRRRYDYTNIYAAFARTQSTEGGGGGQTGKNTYARGKTPGIIVERNYLAISSD